MAGRLRASWDSEQKEPSLCGSVDQRPQRSCIWMKKRRERKKEEKKKILNVKTVSKKVWMDKVCLSTWDAEMGWVKGVVLVFEPCNKISFLEKKWKWSKMLATWNCSLHYHYALNVVQPGPCMLCRPQNMEVWGNSWRLFRPVSIFNRTESSWMHPRPAQLT